MKLNKASKVFNTYSVDFFFKTILTIYKHFVSYTITCIYTCFIRQCCLNLAAGSMAYGLGAQAYLGVVRHPEPWAYPNLLTQDVAGPVAGSSWHLSPWEEMSSGRALVAHPFSPTDVRVYYSLRCTLKWLVTEYDPGKGALFALWVPDTWGTRTPV